MADVKPGAALVALRRRGTIRCARCDTEFVGRLDRRFCSTACRVTAWQQVNAERVNAARRERYRRTRQLDHD